MTAKISSSPSAVLTLRNNAFPNPMGLVGLIQKNHAFWKLRPDQKIVVKGERAWGRTLWLEMANHGPGDTMKMGTYGIYEDEFKKVDGHWLIARRNVLNEFIPNRRSGLENPVGEMDALAEAFLAGP